MEWEREKMAITIAFSGSFCTVKTGPLILMIRALGLNKFLIHKEIVQISLFLAVKRPSRPLRGPDSTMQGDFSGSHIALRSIQTIWTLLLLLQLSPSLSFHQPAHQCHRQSTQICLASGHISSFLFMKNLYTDKQATTMYYNT